MSTENKKVEQIDDEVVTADSFKLSDLLHKEDWLTI